MTADRAGNLLVTGAIGGTRVRMVVAKTGTYSGRPMAAGNIYAIAGQGTATPAAGFASVAVDRDGNIALSRYNDEWCWPSAPAPITASR